MQCNEWGAGDLGDFDACAGVHRSRPRIAKRTIDGGACPFDTGNFISLYEIVSVCEKPRSDMLADVDACAFDDDGVKWFFIPIDMIHFIMLCILWISSLLCEYYCANALFVEYVIL